MTPQEICSLSQASLDKARSLKRDFDLTFEKLVISGEGSDLRAVEDLKRQVDELLHKSPIAWGAERISDKTRIYIGKLEPGIFQALPPSVEGIYTAFPEGEMQLVDIQVGGRDLKGLTELLAAHQVRVFPTVEKAMKDKQFSPLKHLEAMKFIRLTVADLGLADAVGNEELFDRAQELGLELCPSAVSVDYCVQGQDRLDDTTTYIAMESILNRDGDEYIFEVGGGPSGLYLSDVWSGPDRKWASDRYFLFRVPGQR